MLLALVLTGWTIWSPRAEITPRAWNEGDTLILSGANKPGVYGGWQRREAAKPGQWYRYTVRYRAENLEAPGRHAVARLDWLDADGKRTGQPDYAVASGPGVLRIDAPAPPAAAAVHLQLLLHDAPRTTVWWTAATLEPVPAPSPRPVTVAALNYKPRGLKSREENTAAFLRAIDSAVSRKADIIVLPEGMTMVGTGKTYADVAEPVPGPTTSALAAAAKKHKAWIVAGLVEREGDLLYNTAVLLDRSGRLAGRYRKVYLPREELEGGMTPGSEYPVFQTDFGTVGLMICWDIQYPDPARALAARGAELILVPIWGGNEVLGRARAIENRVFIASSGYDYPTYVQDPDGNTLAVAKDRGTAAVATIDLNRRYVEPWLGDMKQRIQVEPRWDVQVRPGPRP